MVLKMLLATGLAGMVTAAAAQPVQPLPGSTDPVPLDAPSVYIGNGLLQAHVYLPDDARGFYRGTRFDRSGVIGSLTLDGQEFYGPWFDRVAPQVMDFVYAPEGIVAGPASAISGPVEEFAPIGFDQAQAGGTFVKIGVGVLTKPDDKPYDHYRLYPVMDAGTRSVQIATDGISFIQDIPGVYRYVKTIRLVAGRPQMRITHELTNSAASPISTTVYDHNFLKLSPGNADLVVSLPFAIKPDTAPDPALARIDGGRIVYLRALAGTERVSFEIGGFGPAARDYDIRVDNVKTGAGMAVTADQPLARMNYWSIRSVMAVEPYIAIALAPGATKRWSYTYTYKAKTP